MFSPDVPSAYSTLDSSQEVGRRSGSNRPHTLKKVAPASNRGGQVFIRMRAGIQRSWRPRLYPGRRNVGVELSTFSFGLVTDHVLAYRGLGKTLQA